MVLDLSCIFEVLLQSQGRTSGCLRVGDISNNLTNHENHDPGDFIPSKLDLTNAPWSRITLSRFWKTLFKTFPVNMTRKMQQMSRMVISDHSLHRTSWRHPNIMADVNGHGHGPWLVVHGPWASWCVAQHRGFGTGPFCTCLESYTKHIGFPFWHCWGHFYWTCLEQGFPTWSSHYSAWRGTSQIYFCQTTVQQTEIYMIIRTTGNVTDP